MQKSDRNEKDEDESSIATRTCPRCGNRKISRSSKKIKDGVLNILFCKFYRCLECRYRFQVMNPLRLVFFTGIIGIFIGLHQISAVPFLGNFFPMPQGTLSSNMLFQWNPPALDGAPSNIENPHLPPFGDCVAMKKKGRHCSGISTP